MFSKIISGSLTGMEGNLIDVEVDLSSGIPALVIVGLPDTAVRESKDRIKAAISNSGFKFPAKRITINLSPANLRKEGTHFDLPIAVAIMTAIGYIKNRKDEMYAVIGELSLDGKVNGVAGALPLAIGIREAGITNIIIPFQNAREISIIKDINIYPVKSLHETAEFLNGNKDINIGNINRSTFVYEDKEEKIKVSEDFSEVRGQEAAKRALQIAAAGFHNVLMSGSPGSGKTMLAKRLPGILPKMTYEEKLEITKIYSIAGFLNSSSLAISVRPFRAPHHSISAAAIIGGGRGPKPGEVSLAHYGVLFLDEMPEFDKNVLEALRQPIEDENVIISRAGGTVKYPAKFLLIGAQNPCPCGFLDDPVHQCTCTQGQIRNYKSKLSGPMIDRIDLFLQINPVKFNELSEGKKGKSTFELRKEVELAQLIQMDRYKKEVIIYNSQLTGGLIEKYCQMSDEAKWILEAAFNRLGLSARASNKIIKIARTIADMEEVTKIEANHISEALQFRNEGV